MARLSFRKLDLGESVWHRKVDKLLHLLDDLVVVDILQGLRLLLVVELRDAVLSFLWKAGDSGDIQCF